MQKTDMPGASSAATRRLRWVLFAVQPLLIIVAFLLMLVVAEVTAAPTQRFILWAREQIAPQPKVVLDENGIPSVNYLAQGGVQIGEQKSPVQVSERLIALVAKHDASRPESAEQIRKLADWIIDNAVVTGDYAKFIYEFSWPKYELEAPWYSALAHGFAIEGLAGAYRVTHDDRYLTHAKLLMRALTIPVADGGLAYLDPDGYWFEEYAKPGAVESRVLNGMMYVLLSLHVYHSVVNDPEAARLFESGVRNLVVQLPKYDFGGFSHYDLLGSTAGHYHQVHIALLDQLHSITHEPIFAEYRDRWALHGDQAFYQKLIHSPQKITVAVAFANWFALICLFEVAAFLAVRRKYPAAVPAPVDSPVLT